ncbi:zinc-dependent alcohol dehydrogenase family protein [Rothia sp. ZJ1223]|uniref:zinc-dependent alcohol dehydrogenase family protein n=1 Tax=Rothia sp. ZJ1223 TaxID=2811098 RepID=UPI00195BF6E6|nr:zinc-dependent alcohol dehydrogenase family protein [Rothia sp. ZJ1223]MBM7052249.1 zinc-dependent alcohol dehydrogenase family protein [Rothia sp. ZJ1223]
MKALVYHGPGQRRWEEVSDPQIIDPTDVIARVDTTTICGTDLHILKGDVPEVESGRILGHEAVGTITEVGASVTDLKVGDRIIIPAVTNCGKCSYCKKNQAAHCQSNPWGVGWIFGYMIDGTQAEYVRVPFAETSVHRVPEGLSDDEVLYLTDALPTGFEIGIENGNTKPGDTVAVIGAGPVGLGAIMTAKLAGAGRVITVDMDDNRMNKALELGATDKVNASDADAVEQIKALSNDGLGVDVAIEAVGIPATFETCLNVVRPFGAVANAGVHGKAVELPLNKLWISNISIATGLVSCSSVDILLNMVKAGRLDAKAMATHYFTFDQFEEAYDLFSNAAEHDAVKVVISRA